MIEHTSFPHINTKRILTGNIISHSGDIDSKMIQSVPVVLYFFGAKWDAASVKIVPILAELYKKWNKTKNNVEIVYISSDQNPQEWQEFYAQMPWLALPFEDSRVCELKLKSSYSGIPFLALMSKEEEFLHNGYNDILEKGDKALDYWVERLNY